MNVVETNLEFKGLSYGNTPEIIILHHAAAESCSIADIHRWHLARGWVGCGYHYFIRKDGTIYRGRPEKAIGAHTLGFNSKSIGISVEGNYMHDTMPDVQKQAVIELCRDIYSRYTIKQISGHKELNTTSCPGVNYPLDEIKTESVKKNNIIEKVVDNMDVKLLQHVLNKLEVRDENGKALDEDGVIGKHTNAAKAKLKEILVEVMK